jgi:hypothetical protein
VRPSGRCCCCCCNETGERGLARQNRLSEWECKSMMAASGLQQQAGVRSEPACVWRSGVKHHCGDSAPRAVAAAAQCAISLRRRLFTWPRRRRQAVRLAREIVYAPCPPPQDIMYSQGRTQFKGTSTRACVSVSQGLRCWYHARGSTKHTTQPAGWRRDNNFGPPSRRPSVCVQQLARAAAMAHQNATACTISSATHPAATT